MKKLKLPKFHWAKLLSIFFFVILLGAYASTFAIGQKYAPGATLDPACPPGEENCTVNIGGESMTYPSAGISVSNGSVWSTSITDNSSNWNTAYGWGNHATAGYVTGTPWTTMGFITDGNTGWDNSYGFITDGNTGWDNSYGFITGYTETDPITGAINGLVKANGAGVIGAVVSGTDIKTLNGTSLLSSGDLLLQAPLIADADYLTPTTATTSFYTKDQLSVTDGSSINWFNITNAPLIGANSDTVLIDGGQMTYVAGYTFLISSSNYKILGDIYSAPQTQITLDAADSTDPRIDVIAVDTSGSVINITGTPSPIPDKPYVDPETELELTFITVPAGSTSPSITSLDVYKENTGVPNEWSASSNSGTIVLNSSSSPRNGSVSIEGTSVVVNSRLTFSPASPYNVNSATELVMYIKSKAEWGKNRKLSIAFNNASGQIGNSVSLNTKGTFGFDSSITTGYQQVAIPVSLFGISSSALATSLTITTLGKDGTQGFYLDDIFFETGTPVMVPASPTVATTDSSYFAFTGNGLVSNPLSATLKNSSVTFANIQNINTNKLLGRSTAGSGPVEEITLGSGLSLVSGTLSSTAGGLISDADFNTKGGTSAGLNLVAGAQYNTFLGYEAGKSAVAGGTIYADNNTAIGYQSLYSNTGGSQNTANGSYSLYSNTYGYENTANGFRSLYSNTGGYMNTANGKESLYANTTGYNNTANGYGSLSFNTTGTYNIANGKESLYRNTTGTYNIGLGYRAGYYTDVGTNTTGDYNIFLGPDTRALADDDQNETVVGYGTIGNGSNTTTIGNTSTLRTYLTGLNLKAGTATTGTAPLKFTSSAGALLSPTEAGAVEYDGSHLYFTATDSGTRFQLDQQASSGLSSDADYNTKGGTSAGLNLVAGAQYNTFLGYEAGKGGVVTNEADNNTAIGYRSLYSNITGYYNTAIGDESLYSNTYGYANTANGMSSLYFNTYGSANTALGSSSGKNVGSGFTANTNSSSSLYLGYDTRPSANGNTNEIVVGYITIGNGSNTTTIGNTDTLRTYLTGLNLKAGTATAGTAPLKFTSGSLLGTTEAGTVEFYNSHLYFTAVDSGTRFQLDQQGGGLTSDADFNTKGGTDAGLNLVAGAQYNTFLGYEAGKSGAGTSTNAADRNTAIGYQSLYSNTTGFYNTANGFLSLYSNTTGYNNTANGMYSLSLNTTGGSNTANGYKSLYHNTTGYQNTANGDESLASNTTGWENTANGYYSLRSNTTGNYNTANGVDSLTSNTTGTYNIGLGYDAGDYISGGVTSNTTGDYNIFIGSSTKPLADNDQNEIVIGYNTVGNGSNTTTLGTGNVLYVGGGSVTGMVARFTNGTGSCDINPTTSSIGCSSDINLKKNITILDKENIDFVLRQDIEMPSTTLDKILTLTPVTYNWNSEENGTAKHIGFIAQEMEQIFPDLVATDEKTGLKSIFYTNLIPYTIEAIQEMDLKVKDLSSLDVTNATSLGSLIKSFLVDQFVLIRELTVNKLNIDGEVCVDEVCITKEQFKQMIIKASDVENSGNTNTKTPPIVIPPVVTSPSTSPSTPPAITPPANNPAQALTPEEIEAQRLADLETERLAKEAEDKAIADKAEADRIEAERLATELEAQNKAGEGTQ